MFSIPTSIPSETPGNEHAPVKQKSGKIDADSRDKADSTPAFPRPADWMFLQPSVLDQMHDAVIVTDLDGIVTGCNRAAISLYGYTADELIGQDIATFYSMEEQYIFREQVLPSVLNTGSFRGEVRNRTHTGDYVYVHLTVTLLRDGDGRPAGMVGFSVDVTVQKLGDLALRRNDDMERERETSLGAPATMRMLARAVENAQDVVLIAEAEPIDGSGPRILYANPAFERMTGYSAAEVVGMTPRILQGPKTDRAALDRIHKALCEWKSVREELINYRKDGSEFAVEISIVPVANEKGWYTHWVSIQRSITEKSVALEQWKQSEADLLQQGRDLRESQRIAGLGTWHWKLATGAMTWSEEIYHVFGRNPALPPPSLEEQSQIYMPVSWERLQAAVRNAVEYGTPYQLDLELVVPEGRSKWIRLCGEVQAVADGRHKELRGTIQGITERKQAEADLRRILERKRLGMQVAALALADVDYTAGLLSLSPEAARMFGLGDDAVVLPRSAVHATFHPEDRDELAKRISACLDPLGTGWFAMEHRVVWPSGEVRWLRVRKKIFFEGEGNDRKPVSGILASTDVTAEKNATEEIQQSEIRFRTMTESLPQMIWTSDAKGQKLFCNQRYLKYIGIPSADMVKLRFEDYLHPDDRLAASETWQRCMATGEPYLQEYQMRRHDGVYRHFIARALPAVNDHGVIDRWLGSITDVHDQKLAEEALRRSEKLATAGRLAASIAHEINNPLAAVTNSIYLALQDSGLSSRTRAFLEMADQELARVAHITTQSLKFHRQSISPELADLGEVMRSALALFALRFRSKQVTIQTELEAGVSVWCLSDDVRQVFTNLLSNSLDATRDHGRIRIRIKPCYISIRNRVPGVRVVIADNGVGVPEAIKARIFEPFVSTKPETGIGLGLWICEGIVKKHGGRTRLRSRTGPKQPGTVVSLFFPADGLSGWRVPPAKTVKSDQDLRKN